MNSRGIEVTPEPEADERRAIVRAVRAPRRHERDPGPWWRSGVEEAALDDPCYAIARPRRSRGAARA